MGFFLTSVSNEAAIVNRIVVVTVRTQVVFRGGEGALQVLPPLVDVIPEARLNLVRI